MTREAAGMVAGALAGLGLSPEGDPLATLLISGGASLLGRLAGSLAVRGEQVLVATHNRYTGWVVHDDAGLPESLTTSSVMFPGGILCRVALICDPRGEATEVQAAGAVESLVGFANGRARREHRVLVLVAAAEVDREPPCAGVATIAEAAERDDFTSWKDSIDVGEVASHSYLHSLQLRPALPLPRSLARDGPVTRRAVLGGLHHVHARAA